MRRIALLAIAFLLVAGGWVLLQRAAEGRRVREAGRPRVAGSIALRGPRAPIEILRDARGVPHVQAGNADDAYFGLGFVHAQDRLGQMLSLVLSARGRTAEILGNEGVPADRLARVVGIGRLADRQASQLDGATARALEAYSAGVNARLGRLRAGLAAPPAQFQSESLPIEGWTPADSIAVLKAWSWGLGASLETSLVLDDLLRRLGPGLARAFFPEGAGVAPLPGGGRPSMARAAGPGFRDPLRRRLGLQASGVGSSAFVLSGAVSASGRPLLAADSHLEATVPAFLHEARVRGGNLDVAGVTVPGIPVFWAGSNGRVAWAATAARASVMDLFVESVEAHGFSGSADSTGSAASPGEPGRYHDGERWRTLATREERIRIDGEGEEVLAVRETRHGPLVNELLPREREPLALAWSGARPGDGIGPMLRAARADDGEAFVAALARHHEPVLAFVYVDAGGAAGSQVAGWIPRRALPSGLVPVSGRSAWAEWHEGVPPDRLPAARVSGDKPFLIVADGPLEPGPSRQAEWLWRTGERARRLEALLSEAVAGGAVPLRRLTELQLDVASGRADEILDPALALAGSPAQLAAEEREILILLRDWDRRAEAGSVAAGVYHVFLGELTRALFAPVLGDDLYERWVALIHGSPVPMLARLLAAASSGREAIGPPEWTRRRVAEAVRASLRSTWLHFGVNVGPNRDKWSWGRVHTLSFRPFGVLRFAGAPEPELGPHPYPGGPLTVAVAGYDWSEPFAARTAATHRLAVDAAELDKLLVSSAPGQVEQQGDPHRTDGVARWLEGRPELLLASPILLEEHAVARLWITPETGREAAP